MPKPLTSKARRRPRLHEMERVDTRMVRPYAQVGQATAYVVSGTCAVELDLIWLSRTAGTFGSGSGAYASYLRLSLKKEIDGSTVERIGNHNDRGFKTAWILYFKCPSCGRRCRVLYSKKKENLFGCVKCNRPAYPSNCWPYTGRISAGGISKLQRERIKHEQAAARVIQQISRKTRKNLVTSKAKANHVVTRPPKMSYLKFNLLCLKAVTHRQKALAALLIAFKDTVVGCDIN
jgi:hypothetical protein